jgi:hypothetical protein
MATTFVKPTLSDRIDQHRKFISNVKLKLALVREEFAKTKNPGCEMWIDCTLKMLEQEEEYFQDLIAQRMNERYYENMRKQYYEMLQKDSEKV